MVGINIIWCVAFCVCVHFHNWLCIYFILWTNFIRNMSCRYKDVCFGCQFQLYMLVQGCDEVVDNIWIQSILYFADYRICWLVVSYLLTASYWCTLYYMHCISLFAIRFSGSQALQFWSGYTCRECCSWT